MKEDLKKIRQIQFIEKSQQIHNYKYSYEFCVFNNIKQKVIIICPIHKKFEQTPEHHLQGQGCPQCSKNKKLNLELFIEKTKLIHKDKYDYSLVNYVDYYQKIKIICHIHGIFEQSPKKHLSGQNCLKCSRINNINKNFINLANVKHNNKYNYSKSIYKNAKTKLIIICPIHGEFEQTPDNHLAGHGCIKCIGIISKKETKWLDSLNIKYRNIRLPGLGNKKVDGYDPITNTVYEFYGDFWHGNPEKFQPNEINKKINKTFGELYKETIKREELIKKNSYNLIFKWENDFKME